MTNNVIIRQLGIQAYQLVLVAMQRFTERRKANTIDEIWLVQHPPVFTQGNASESEYLLLIPGDIPVVQSDRGGKITYHGPGQQVMYVMLDLRRRNLLVRDLITILEKTVITTLYKFAITTAYSKKDAPGVYVGDDKICSIGLRIRKGCSLHGLALNIAMDLSPFLLINPCGEVGLRMTQLSRLSPVVYNTTDVVKVLLEVFLSLLGGTNTGAIKTWHYNDYLNNSES
ncbi:lipoyl(octanoyl) transferase LipB [Candidatus Palibaumannia cicadellinicola]|uniref:Octanoyltransferase n=1 Tax=Baumannia cicadellinicola subsp. Homalodisca coagulata TaxID=374463 RepID=LIPB_BAUCH|nr:lipoyl(octanoyl) transferase LipB [Candidatus Baumannia cicadellinicola]Q1LTM4.1 RecName: Full=Octanoyltransferase; AltName: Full=Lipoate-protein ligase B; AltName: Full=Lipoyl/octanoyl transferase; AltName: Full=Octanoyl-[acyl-carrier-protein]-protein N-octanoyltransferase [Baumannia cicadellinicola str. Hc (Homalodisca coagulata)]ABF13905.1 lipoate-protein ligase B [Baumannia cicadellinicola str. Hc (Homalodisca coagulata)]